MTSPPSGAASGHAPSPFDYLSLMLLRWRLIAGTAAAAGVVALATTFVLSSQWTAKTSFLPVSNAAGAVSSALGSLAGDLGITLPGGATTDGPEFYLALIKSRPIIDAVLRTRYAVGGDSLTLLEVLDAGGSTDAQRRERARDDLLDRLGASSDRTTRIVSLAIRAPDPQLAAAVANRFVELANRLSLRTQFENSRIQEVNDTPVLSVIEEAVPPVQRSSPRRGRTTALALLLGGVLGAGLALSQGAIEQLRSSADPGYARLEAIWLRRGSRPAD
ncbi:MAG: hypothetical protein IPK12_22460 [Gemmatimonadetes bacterium]|nr:hypothetical protein [Gemmatimonadota bacterium]